MAIASYSDLQTDIQLWLNRSGDTAITGNVADFIALAEQSLRTDLQTLFMESRSAAVSVSTEFLTLTSINANITKLRRLYNSTTPNTPLRYLTPDQLITEYPSGELGTPRAYTIEAGELQFAPVPDTTYTFNANFRAWLNPLSVTPTNTLLTNWPGLYLFSSLRETAAFINDTDAEAYWRGRYAEVLVALRAADTMLRYPDGSLQVRGDTGNP